MSKNKKEPILKLLENVTEEEQAVMYASVSNTGGKGMDVNGWKYLESLHDTIIDGCKNDKGGYDWQEDREIIFEVSDFDILVSKIKDCPFTGIQIAKIASELVDRMAKIDVLKEEEVTEEPVGQA